MADPVNIQHGQICYLKLALLHPDLIQYHEDQLKLQEQETKMKTTASRGKI